MIHPEDTLKFHKPNSDSPQWTETNMFSFQVPERSFGVTAYVLARPTVGAVLSDITMFDRISLTQSDVLYSDIQTHLPMPQGELGDFTLANGLHIKTLKPPTDYQIDYQGIDDTEFHVVFRGLMPPQDINDPDMDPVAVRSEKTYAEAYNGHFEITGHITGECCLRGKRFPIDCVSTMDHSWGVRPERDTPTMAYMNVHFGKDLAIHSIFRVDPEQPEFAGFLHGYVLDNGTVYGIRAGHGSAIRLGQFPITLELTVTDIRGKSFHLTGSPIASTLWQNVPNIIDFYALLKCNLNGRIGYGQMFDACSMAAIGRRNSAR